MSSPYISSGSGYSSPGASSPSYPTSHASGYDVRCFPEEYAPQDALLAFRDRIIDVNSLYRNRQLADIALWTWYYLGQQWAEVDTRIAFDGIRGAIFQNLGNSADDPRPVTNEIDPAIEQAVISLVKRKWKFVVNPTSNDPALKAAAQVASDATNTRLRALQWDVKRRQHALSYAITGTGLIYTGVDRPYTALKMIGSPEGVYCHNCQNRFYSSVVPADVLQSNEKANWTSTAESLGVEDYGEDMGEMVQLHHCPVCEDQNELRSMSDDGVEFNDQEMNEGKDMFGRPLGLEVAQYNSTLEVDSPFDVYPEDHGYKKTPDNCRRYGRRKMRSLDWVEERYPHLAHLVQPQPISELIYNDPLIGAWNDFQGYYTNVDAKMLDYHVNVDEVWEEPGFKHPYGRYMVCVPDLVMEEGKLLEEGRDEKTGEMIWVPRAQEHGARFKIIPDRYFGNGLASIAISPQNMMNGYDAQEMGIRETVGKPIVVMPHDMWWTDDNSVSLNQDGRGVGQVLLIKPSLAMPDVSGPQIQPGVTLPTDTIAFRNIKAEFLQRAVGPKPATLGNAPKNVGTTSGLNTLIDQDEASQTVREDELTGSVERAATHICRMEWVLRVDPEVYGVQGPDKVWDYTEYTGQMMRGQCEVTIERGPVISRGILNREAAREAIADKIVDPNSSPIIRRKLLELYGLDQDLAPDLSNQVDHAHRVFIDWREKKIVRTQDNIDDPVIHHIVLSTHFRDQSIEQYADAINWDDVNRGIAGWQDTLTEMLTAEAQSMMMYGGRVEEVDAGAAFAQAKAGYMDKLALYKKSQGANAEANSAAVDAGGQPTMVGAPPPVEPLPPTNFPPLLQDKILTIWIGLLGKRQNPVFPLLQQLMQPPQQDEFGNVIPVEGAPAEGEPDPLHYMKLRALCDAYRLTAYPLPIMQQATAAGAGGGPAPEAGGGGTAPPNPPATGAMPGGGPH